MGKEQEQEQNTSTEPTSNLITDQEIESGGQSHFVPGNSESAIEKSSFEGGGLQPKGLSSLTLNQPPPPPEEEAATATTTTTDATPTSQNTESVASGVFPPPSFSFRNPSTTQAEQALLDKFENEVMTNKEAMASLHKLKIETKDKYLYQIKRYIRFCANKGLSNFPVTSQLAQQLIESEMMKRGGSKLTENTIRSIRSPLNKLYFMNKIVYGEQNQQQPEQQPEQQQQQNEILGEQFIQHMMSSMSQEKNPRDNNEDTKEGGSKGEEGEKELEGDEGGSNVQSMSSSGASLFAPTDPLPSSSSSIKPSSLSSTKGSSSHLGDTTHENIQTQTSEPKLPQSDHAKSPMSVSSSTGIILNPDNTSIKSFGLSGNSKHRLSPNEEALLRKFDQEILNNPKTQDILSNLTGNTFKSYATDIKRFIKYCARKGKTDFLIDDDILTRFLTFQTSKSGGGSSSSGSPSSSVGGSASGSSSGNIRKYNLKNTRTSLLKLHQLNCLAYDLEFSEGDIILTLNKFLDSTNTATQPTSTSGVLTTEQLDLAQDLEFEGGDPLLDKLQHYYQTSTILHGLSNQSKKLYSNEFNRYALFCSQLGLQNFQLTGDLIKRYFIEEVIAHTPTISTKKLKEILSRLNRLHNLNVEIDPANTPKQIENVQIVKEFINEYGKKSHSDSPAQPSSASTSAASGSGSGGNGNGGNGTSSSSTSGNGNGADTLSGASTSGSSITSGLPHLNFSNNPTSVLTGSSSSSSEQPSGGELSGSVLRRSSASQNPKTRLKSSFQSYSSRPDIIDTTSVGGASSSSGVGDQAENYAFGQDVAVPSRLGMVVENERMGNIYKSDDDEQIDESNVSLPRSTPAAAKSTHKQDTEGHVHHYDHSQKSQSSPPSTSSSSKRQKLDSLPETSDSIPKFVMNKDIESVTQLVEEWTLIIKRNEKYGQAWIKTMSDLQLYNGRKLIISLIEEILPVMNEEFTGKRIEEIYAGTSGELALFELALVFDQYIGRKNLTIDDLIKKIENYPGYVKREFVRILSRRKSTPTSTNVPSGGGAGTSSSSSSASVPVTEGPNPPH
ncbi:hypothetical protein I9W82_002259 [Candida metapsilosis]|uniref:Transcription activator GCR1-like domain-containing protein n=1 Tax=Candida metapsilosis TaxID=273372 RepID=A0A8H7ZJD4_9ASCO|nr:hypothetical protein I9W82_002259 [Candida metapsilosis]